jgi:hypothetical protein
VKATDLIGCDVYGADGVRVGRVHDLKFELSTSGGRPTGCRLTALDCGTSAAIGHRLGYGTGDMAGPWPLSVLFERYREKSLRTVRWADVAEVAGRRIALRTPGARTSAPTGVRP